MIGLCEPKAAQELPFGCTHKTLLKGSLTPFMPSTEKCQPLNQARLRQIWPCPHATYRCWWRDKSPPPHPGAIVIMP